MWYFCINVNQNLEIHMKFLKQNKSLQENQRLCNCLFDFKKQIPVFLTLLVC